MNQPSPLLPMLTMALSLLACGGAQSLDDLLSQCAAGEEPSCSSAYGRYTSVGDTAGVELLGSLGTSCDAGVWAACEQLGVAVVDGYWANLSRMSEACDAGYLDACVGAAHPTLVGGESEAILAEACDAGAHRACSALGYYKFELGHDDDGRDLLERACGYGSWYECATLAFLDGASAKGIEVLSNACRESATGVPCLSLAATLSSSDETHAADLGGARRALSDGCSRGHLEACLTQAEWRWYGIGGELDPWLALDELDSLCTLGYVPGCEYLEWIESGGREVMSFVVELGDEPRTMSHGFGEAGVKTISVFKHIISIRGEAFKNGDKSLGDAEMEIIVPMVLDSRGPEADFEYVTLFDISHFYLPDMDMEELNRSFETNVPRARGVLHVDGRIDGREAFDLMALPHHSMPPSATGIGGSWVEYATYQGAKSINHWIFESQIASFEPLRMTSTMTSTAYALTNREAVGVVTVQTEYADGTYTRSIRGQGELPSVAMQADMEIDVESRVLTTEESIDTWGDIPTFGKSCDTSPECGGDALCDPIDRTCWSWPWYSDLRYMVRATQAGLDAVERSGCEAAIEEWTRDRPTIEKLEARFAAGEATQVGGEFEQLVEVHKRSMELIKSKCREGAPSVPDVLSQAEPGNERNHKPPSTHKL